MKIKFHVLGSGESSFHSNKTNRDYRRVRLMGFAEDAFGEQVPATADMGFDVALSVMPKQGDLCVLNITELSTKSSMTELTFSALEIVPAKKS